jgi:nuclear pore complex protein Nup85
LGELEGFSLQTSLYASSLLMFLRLCSRSYRDLSLRATLLIEYAEHIYTDPSLWRVTLEYLGACGSEGAAMAAELIKRVSIDIDFPTDISDATVVVTEKDPRPSCFTPDGGTPASRAWAEWEDKVLKIITVCKDYGLEEVLTSVCKVLNIACDFLCWR